MALVVAVLLIYTPVLWADFIWDDTMLVTSNPQLLGRGSLLAIWTTDASQFFPLVMTTIWAIHELWGLNPLPYHLANVFFHATSAVLLWRVLKSLNVPGAWLGAALWAVHPIQVESVAWVSELKNTQSGVFYLLTLFVFVKWLRTGKPGLYALVLLLAAMAVTSKPSTVILPGVLCLCAWWVEKRWNWRNLAYVSPIILMSVAGSILTVAIAGVDGPNTQGPFVRSWPERLITAGDEIWFYLGKLLWPQPLILIYPRWQIDASQPLEYLPLLAAIGLLFVFWLYRAGWGRPYFFTFAYFIGALVPVMGFVSHNYLRTTFVGDHFQYLPGMGPLALAGAGMATLVEIVPRAMSWAPKALCAIWLLVLGVVSWQRAWVYENAITVWSDTLAQNPTCRIAYNNLGDFFANAGRLDEAIAVYEKASEIDPHDAADRCNEATALLQEGRLDMAAAKFHEALNLAPNLPNAHSGLGNVLFQQGHTDEAIAEYVKALQIDSNFVEAYTNLAAAFMQKGRTDDAIHALQKSVELEPWILTTRINLGLCLAQTKRFDEAIVQFQAAVKIDPNFVQGYANLGGLLLLTGRVDEAIVQLKKAITLNPGFAQAHNSMGNALLQKGLPDQALAEFQEAASLDPNNAYARANVAKAQAAVRKAHGTQ